MTTTIDSQKISSYLTSYRLSSGQFKGTQGEFLHRYAEELRLYNKISKTPYTTAQSTQFLNAAVNGVANLESCYMNLEASRLAVGNTDEIQFATYLSSLMKLAAVYDEPNGHPVRFQHQSNAHTFELNEHQMKLEDPDTDGFFEGNIHDAFSKFRTFNNFSCFSISI